MQNLESISISWEVLRKIGEIDEFKGEWKVTGTTSPEALSHLRRLATIQSTGSAIRLSGGRVSDNQVTECLAERSVARSVGVKGSSENSWQLRVMGYFEVLNAILNESDLIEFSEVYIRQMHRDLLYYSDRDSRDRGVYKSRSSVFEVLKGDDKQKHEYLGIRTAFPSQIPRLMTELVNWTRNELNHGQIHPIIVSALFVVHFLSISPFSNGNLRLSHLIAVLLLRLSGYSYMAYVSLEKIVENNQGEYNWALHTTRNSMKSESVDWTPWVTCFVRIIHQHKALFSNSLEVEHRFSDPLSPFSEQIMELARSRGRVSVLEIHKVTRISRNTIKGHLKMLSQKGYLKMHGAGRGTWYSPG